MEQTLVSQNPWWKTGAMDEEYRQVFPRKHFGGLVAELNDWRITSLIGPRRAGKTVLLHQIIRHLLEQRVERNRIVYLQFGKPLLNQPGIIERLVDFISHQIGEPIGKKTGRVYLLLDEVHKLETWAEELKDLVDLRLNIKILVSGSSSLRIIRGGGEGLAGRISHHLIFPLDFREFAGVKLGLQVPDEPVERLYHRLLGRAREINILFGEFLKKGGYPECVQETSLSRVYKMLLDYKDLSFEKDIFELTEIRDTKTLNEAMFLLASLLAQRITYYKLGAILHTKLDTVKKYISLFEDIFLVREQVIYSRKPYFSLRQERKVSFTDPGMANALNERFDFDDVSMAALVENVVARKVLEQRLATSVNAPHYYWVSEDGGEVDVVDVEKGNPLPIEVKYRKRVDVQDLKPLLTFMGRFNVRKGIVVTRDTLEKRRIDGKTVLLVPAWLFLLAG